MREKVTEYNIDMEQLNRLFHSVALSSIVIFTILLTLLWVLAFFKLDGVLEFFKLNDSENHVFLLHAGIFAYIYVSFRIADLYFQYSWKMIVSNVTKDIRRHYKGMLCDKEAFAFLKYKASGIFDEEYKYLEKELCSK